MVIAEAWNVGATRGMTWAGVVGMRMGMKMPERGELTEQRLQENAFEIVGTPGPYCRANPTEGVFQLKQHSEEKKQKYLNSTG